MFSRQSQRYNLAVLTRKLEFYLRLLHTGRKAVPEALQSPSSMFPILLGATASETSQKEMIISEQSQNNIWYIS